MCKKKDPNKKGFFGEFKDFITRGNVMDLAVGMIIGAAFTAIITAVVTGILTPLINMIPGTGDTSALITILKEAVYDADGNVVQEAVILNWGAVISAIITFLCTALVLFLIVKAFNTAKKRSEQLKAKAEEKLKKEQEVAAEETPAEEAPAAPAEPVETTDDILKDIRELLKAQKGEEK